MGNRVLKSILDKETIDEVIDPKQAFINKEAIELEKMKESQILLN